jgi:RNA polymerase sigma factor (sigma-70 family)
MTPKSLLHPARLARRPVLSTQSDSRLVDLVRAGYEPAFEAIVDRYRRPLLRYARRLLPAERAEDVVQLAFVNAYEAIRRDSRELDLRPWLYRIAHNATLNALRDRGLHHVELADDWDGVERPEQAVERREGLRDVVDAVQALPERQRDAIVLRELEGRSYEEIAGRLGVTDGAVRQLLNRARTTLRGAVTAVTPVALVGRIPWAASAEPATARVAEAFGAAGAGALAAKACATVLVTGAVVGGVAVAPDGGGERSRAVDDAVAAETAERASAAPAAAVGSGPGPGEDLDGGPRGSTSGSGHDRDDDRGGDRGGRDRDHDADRGGRSGHDGPDDEAALDDNSELEDARSGSSGSGSGGPGTSGSAAGASGSGSGTSGSRSGTSGSGSEALGTPEPDQFESPSGLSGSGSG